MSTLTFRHFVAGPDAWQPATKWHPLLAILATLVVLGVSQIVPIAVVVVLRGTTEGLFPDPSTHKGVPALQDFLKDAAPSILLLVQATLAMLTFGLASLYRSDWRQVLALEPPKDGLRAYAFAILVLVPLVAAINGAGYWLYRAGFMSDFKQFAELVRSPQVAAMGLSVTVGAPLWEETLFRGFLLGALAARIGYWPSAVLVAGAWTALHLNYSAAGLAEVFVLGLYFAWLLKRTGSLWVPIACHALYNGVLFAAMRLLPMVM